MTRIGSSGRAVPESAYEVAVVLPPFSERSSASARPVRVFIASEGPKFMCIVTPAETVVVIGVESSSPPIHHGMLSLIAIEPICYAQETATRNRHCGVFPRTYMGSLS